MLTCNSNNSRLKFNSELLNVKKNVMKKIFSTSSIILSAIMAMVFLAACQKDQDAVSTETAAASSENTVVGVAGSEGQGVTSSYAGALAYNYTKKYNEDNQSQYVVFDAATLSKFIANLQTKYGSKKVYINFGVYGKGAPAQNSKDNGRLTVFLTGDKIPAPTSGRRNDGIVSDLTDEFLNHGGLLP